MPEVQVDESGCASAGGGEWGWRSEMEAGGPCEALRLFCKDALYTFLLQHSTRAHHSVRQSQQARLQCKGFTASWFTFDTDGLTDGPTAGEPLRAGQCS
jgi:hypothetical protein